MVINLVMFKLLSFEIWRWIFQVGLKSYLHHLKYICAWDLINCTLEGFTKEASKNIDNCNRQKVKLSPLHFAQLTVLFQLSIVAKELKFTMYYEKPKTFHFLSIVFFIDLKLQPCNVLYKYYLPHGRQLNSVFFIERRCLLV